MIESSLWTLRLTDVRAIVAGLNNTIVQLVYLTKPLVAESEGNAGFFQSKCLEQAMSNINQSLILRFLFELLVPRTWR